MANIEDRVVKYDDLIPCKNAFIDTRTPGSDSKENFTIIGPGVSENPNQYVHIPEPHGFNIGAARQPYGCTNSQHSHETAEVFVIHSGHWKFLFGPNCEDGYIEGKPGDVISVPTKMFRGFEKVDDGQGFLWVVLGQDNPGKVIWAPKVFELAKEYGLVLLENGRLIDTVAGEDVPTDAKIQAVTSDQDVNILKTPDLTKIAKNCIVKIEDMKGEENSQLANEKIQECPIIGASNTNDGFEAGPIIGWWQHGFVLRGLKIDAMGVSVKHKRKEEEVIFVHEGDLEVIINDQKTHLGKGDTITIPKNDIRQFNSIKGCMAYIVRGGDNPSPLTEVSE